MAGSLYGLTKYLIILTVIKVCMSIQCMEGLPTLGYTYPHGDIVIEYGNPLEITCVIDNKTYLEKEDNPTKNLIFMRNKVDLTEKVEVLNSTSIRLYDEDVPMSSSTYTCAQVNGTERKAVCQNIVTVGRKPENVTDFSCISLNWDNLTCTWTRPENYVKTDYNVSYFIPGRSGRLKPHHCDLRKDEGNQSSCFWNTTTTTQYRQAQPRYTFIMKMSNVFGPNNLSYDFDHYKYVKSGPPENLHAVSVTTNSIFLQWQIPNTMQSFPLPLKNRILYQCSYGPKNFKLAAVLLVQGKANVTYNLTGIPYANNLCDIRVSLLSNKSTDESMWSGNASITHRTASTVPGAPPRVNIGSFEFGNVFNNTQQIVFIYWQEVPEEIQNGDDITYLVREKSSDIQPIKKKQTYAEYRLLTTKEYVFEIWAKNSEGESLEKSYITVPVRRWKPPSVEISLKNKYSDGTYELHLGSVSYSQNITNYTIFWCNNACEGHINWTVIPAGTTDFNLTVPEVSNWIWRFAASVNTKTYSSGMEWGECSYKQHNQKIGKIDNLFKIGNGTSTSIQLGWKLVCIYDKIEGFIISYCPKKSPEEHTCIGTPKNVTIKGDATTKTGTVTDLKPYTIYRFWVSILFKSGDVGPESDRIEDTTLEGVPSKPQNMDILEVTNSSIQVTWDAPEDINGNIRFYKIFYNDKYEIREGDKVHSYTLSNLESYKSYNIYVEACTIACSDRSDAKMVTTEIGVPGRVAQPKTSFQNDSYILIDWKRPSPPRGKNDYYQIMIKEKTKTLNNENAHLYNVTETRYPIVDCAGELNAIIVSVRAVNIYRSEHLEGPWSDELECYCSKQLDILFWFAIIFIVVAFLCLILIIKKMVFCCKDMKNVELKLPPGLAPIPDWTNPKGQEELEHTPSADEELLLVKMTENRIPSGESSGCCSGHESVASDSGTAISSTSDSGTEQNELRKRPKTTSAANTGTSYITMPTDPVNKPRTKPAGNYCVLGVDPNAPIDTENSFVTPAPTTKLPYISCDSVTPPAPYVLTSDVNKPGNSGYIPLNYPDLNDKNPAYVMAGTKMPDIGGTNDKPMYVQVADPTKNWHVPADNLPAKGYISIGEPLPLAKRAPEAKKGYVPHRHFDSKLLKED